MTREEFIQVLETEGYSYEIDGDKLVVTYGGNVWLKSLKKLPSGVEFKNGKNVYFHSLKEIPPGVVFNNGEDVWLYSIIGRHIGDWDGNIEGVASKRLLNVIIKRGMFI